MKRTIAAALASALLIATSCSNDPIFAAIENEVQKKDPSLPGFISSMAVWNGAVFTANGTLQARTGASRSWNKMGLPPGAFRCAQVASSGEAGALFALFQNGDWDFESLRRYDGTNWTTVNAGGKIVKIANGDGFAYAFREDSASYNREGIQGSWSALRVATDGTVSVIASGLTSLPVTGAGNWFATASGVYTSGGTQINLDDGDADLNDFPSYGICGLATDGATLFVARSGYIYRWDGASWTRFAHDTDTPVTGITWLKGAGKNVLLISGSDGYGEVVLDATDVPERFQNPGDNDQSSISTGARDAYETALEGMNTSFVMAVTSPSVLPAGDAYALYLGVVDKTDNGLWGYYQTTQTEWNVE